MIRYIKNNIHKIGILKFKDIIDFLKIILSMPFGFILSIIKPNIWLFSERENDAKDNSYWLFKYVTENNLIEDAYYAISYKSAEAEKIKNIGKSLNFGTFRHHIYFWAAKNNISSHTGDGFPAPFMCRQFLLMGFYSFNNIFLQHGVTYNNASYLHSDKNSIDFFCVSSQEEQKFVIEQFEYNKEQVPLLGMCRFDNLKKTPNINHKKTLLIMPTWRNTVAPKYNEDIELSINRFLDSAYYKFYNSLIMSPFFHDFIQRNDINVKFCQHNQFQMFNQFFCPDSDNIEIIDLSKNDVQDLLITSDILITDYSSIFFDFAYMEKPIIHTCFDYEEFYNNHYLEGYFSIKENGFGTVVETHEDLFHNLGLLENNNFRPQKIHIEKVNDFFYYRDRDHCERHFDFISQL